MIRFCTASSLITACLLCWGVAQAQPPSSEPTSAREPDTFSFAPAFRFEAFDDFSVGFELRGLTPQGARVTSRLTAGPNPEDQLTNAALSYEQPLAPLLTQDPATLRVAVRSDFTQGHPLALEGRTYTERLAQFSVGLEQPLGVLEVGLEARVVRAQTFLEDETDDDEVTLLPDDAGGVLEASLRYTGQVSPGVPNSGGAAELTLGYGVGDADESLSWTQAGLELRGYFGFDERGVFLRDAPRFVLASRFRAEANLGDAPLWRRLSPDLRGYGGFALVGERTLDLSADLRYHTGLNAPFGSGFALFAFTPYLFTDAGNAWDGDSERRYRDPELSGGVQVSFGAGAQIGLETPFVELPLNIWYARGAQGGAVGFEVSYLY